MGIKGLHWYLKKKKFFRDILLTEYKAVVIDGNSICCTLYEKCLTDWKEGGEYKEFSKVVRDFFKSLTTDNVSPIVVLEGLRDPFKFHDFTKKDVTLNTILEDVQKHGYSQSHRIVLPTLVLPTFFIIAHEMGCEINISAGEGDLLTAAISNEQQCPVLAIDSDYYMFELHHGYIPFDDSFEPPKCKLYHVKDFQDHFKLQDPMLRLLIPAIHGNEFIPPRDPDYQDYRKTLHDLRYHMTCESYLKKEKRPYLRDYYQTAKKRYCDKSSPEAIIQDYVRENSRFPVNIRGSSIDTHFCLIRIATTTTKTHVNVMRYAIEDISRESVWNCSQYIRQFMYGFLGIEEVREMTREKGTSKIKESKTKCKNLKPPVAINEDFDIVVHHEAEALSLDDKKGIIRAVLKCNKMSENCWSELLSLEPKYQLPVATAFYWYHSSHLATSELLKALLFCFLDIDIDIDADEQHFSWETVHAFSEWQSVYHDALALNYMVHSPFMATNPGMLFSGKKALYCAQQNFDHWHRDGSQDLLLRMLEIVTSHKEKGTENPALASDTTTTTTTTPSTH